MIDMVQLHSFSVKNKKMLERGSENSATNAWNVNFNNGNLNNNNKTNENRVRPVSAYLQKDSHSKKMTYILVVNL